MVKIARRLERTRNLRSYISAGKTAANLMRRISDIALASAVLLFCLPLLLVVAFAIRLETRGPILDRHPRIGRGGRRFDMLNFRVSRYHDAQMRTRWGNERTRVGEFLCCTRMERLPEFVNVLRGDLTIFPSNGHTPSFLV
jgi:lipopolysaccharide/colanic/teichoic acid biosynthesis glycosyltransferase